RGGRPRALVGASARCGGAPPLGWPRSPTLSTTRGGTAMPKSVPNLPGLEPGPLPFSKVVEANGFVFLAGTVGEAPDSHGAVPGGIEAETRAMLDNVGRLLRTLGLDYGDVVRCTVYLLDFTEFAAMNAV